MRQNVISSLVWEKSLALCFGTIYIILTEKDRIFHNNSSVKRTEGMTQYIAVRQRSGHDFLCVDLQRADRLPSTSVFSLDSKFCDEAVDAVRQEPRNHDGGVVLSKRCQVGHQARGCRKPHIQINVHTHKHTMLCIFNYGYRFLRSLCKCVCMCMNTHGTQLSLCIKIC